MREGISPVVDVKVNICVDLRMAVVGFGMLVE